MVIRTIAKYAGLTSLGFGLSLFAYIGMDVTLEAHYLGRYGLDANKAQQIKDLGDVLFMQDRALPAAKVEEK